MHSREFVCNYQVKEQVAKSCFLLNYCQAFVLNTLCKVWLFFLNATTFGNTNCKCEIIFETRGNEELIYRLCVCKNVYRYFLCN